MERKEVIEQAVEFAKGFKGNRIDTEEHMIIIPFGKDTTEEEVMGEGMLGKWFADNGFDITFSTGDIEYMTKGGWMNYSGWVKESGHKAYLRNRLIATITW